MNYFESIQDVERQLNEALASLQKFEDDISNDQAWARLTFHTPNHPVLLARIAFLLGTGVFGVAALAAFLLPFIQGSLDPATRRQLPIEAIQGLEAAMGMPLPVALGAVTLCFVFGFISGGFAAVSLGRDAPMLDWEQKEHEKLTEEVKRLTQLKTAIQRSKGTPAGSRGRIATPSPTMRTAGPSSSGGGGGAPDDMLVNFGDGPLVAFDDGPLVAAPTPAKSFEGPTAPHYAAPTGTPVGADARKGGFNKERPLTAPDPAKIREPWVREIVERALALTDDFPIQARIEFSVEQGLPFTLVLERATPAMAVRAMMAYVELLAAIPTPPRARIDFLGSVHMDRNFQRALNEALEPHFPDTVDVERDGERIEFVFHRPDGLWTTIRTLRT